MANDAILTKPGKPNGKKLTHHELVAINEYLRGGTQAEAFQKAYPSAKFKQGNSLNVAASKLFKRPQVLQEVARLQLAIGNKTQDLRERWDREVAEIAFADLSQVVEAHGHRLTHDQLAKLPPHVKRMITRIRPKSIRTGPDTWETLYEIEAYDKLKAMELLAKSQGYVRESAGNQSGPVQINVNFGPPPPPENGGETTENLPNQAEVITVKAEEIPNSRRYPDL